ncbi:MAG: hypothetical protein M5U28_41200 [Sandaracinaceae bacterium]|nr:hypothetical protein [Sandaracinaceae bacterium]
MARLPRRARLGRARAADAHGHLLRGDRRRIVGHARAQPARLRQRRRRGRARRDERRARRAALLPSQSGTYYVAAHASAGSGIFEVRAFRGPTGLEIRMDDIFREAAPPEAVEAR